jgi:predicted RecB family nuclease
MITAKNGIQKYNNQYTARVKPPQKLRTCVNGHQYYKSSDCLVCHTCEKERKPKDGFLSLLAAPARRALESKGISTLKKLSGFSEAAISALHGMGPNSMAKLRSALKSEGLRFKR